MQIDTSVLPQLDWRVRRRKHRNLIFLIRRNEWYELDKAHDLFWTGAICGLSFREIVARLMAEEGVSTSDATVLVSGIFANLLSFGLILPDDH